MILQEVVQRATVVEPSHNHTVIALWVMIGLSVVEAVVIWITVKARGGWAYIATIPFVNLRQLVSLVLASVTIIGTGMVGYFSGVWPPEYIFFGSVAAISTWMGLDIWQYTVKRNTTDASIPSTQNIMAAQAASGTAVDARTARNVAAPTARQPIPGQTTEQPAPSAPPIPTSHERGD